MAWLIDIMHDGGEPEFEFEGKSGLAKSGPGSLPFYLWIGQPKVADITNVPTVARLINDVPLHDAFWIAHTGVVSQRLRDVIEGNEPNTHQFFPLKLHRKNGSLIPDNYFIMHVTQRVPCVFFKKSKNLPNPALPK